jgi:hypothetical protein
MKIVLYWGWHTKLTGDDTILTRNGNLHTRTQRLKLFGMAKWTKLLLSIHPLDKANIKALRDEIIYHVARGKMGQFKVCYWIHYEDSISRPGFWMITVDDHDTKTKELFIYADGKLRHILSDSPKVSTLLLT